MNDSQLTPPCARWVAIFEREAEGEAIGNEDRVFLAAHARGCAACGRELGAWHGLAGALDRVPVAADETRRLAEAALARVRADAARPTARAWTRPRVFMALAAAGAMAAAAALLIEATPRDADLALAPVEGARAPTVRVALAESAESTTTPVRVGDHVPVGSALRAGRQSPLCLTMEPRTVVCLAPDTEIEVKDASATTRRIRLVKGRLLAAIAARAPGTSFAVITEHATFRAVGTRFVVLATERAPAVLRVYEGQVAVETDGRPSHHVGAGASFAITRGEAGASSGLADHLDRDLDRLALAIEAGDRDAVRAQAAAFAAEPALVPSAEADAAPSPARRHPARRTLHASPAAPPVDATDLLAEARALRSAGRYPDAAALYRKVMAEFPKRPEARTTLVLLAELELGELGRPRAALALFDRYLASGDAALDVEASYGRIKAFAALGERAREASAIRALLARRPPAALVRTLEGRLRELEVAGPQQ